MMRWLLSQFQRVDLNAAVCEMAIRLRRDCQLKVPDAIIAASAATQNEILLTNDRQLLGVAGLRSQAVEIQHG